MANHKGSEGTVKVGANTVAEIKSFSVDRKMDPLDDTELGDTAVTRQTGEMDWSGEMECHWDETDTNGQEALTIGASVTLNLYPEGATGGDVYFTGTALVTGVGVAVTRNAITSRRFTFVGTGALTQTAV